MKEKDHFEFLHTDKKNTKMALKEIGWKSMDWINTEWNSDKWQVLVN